MIKFPKDELKTGGNVREVLMYAAAHDVCISENGVRYALEKLAGQMPEEFPCPQHLDNILTSFSIGKFISESGCGTKYIVNVTKDVLLKQLSEKQNDNHVEKIKKMGEKFLEFLEEHERYIMQN